MPLSRREAEDILAELGVDSETFAGLTEREILEGSEIFQTKVFEELTDQVESFLSNPMDYLEADTVRIVVDLSILKNEVLEALGL